MSPPVDPARRRARSLSDQIVLASGQPVEAWPMLCEPWAYSCAFPWLAVRFYCVVACRPHGKFTTMLILSKSSLLRHWQYVRLGSKADRCTAISNVRFAPNSDRENGRPHTVMSALPLKADVCGALAHVCFGPKADIVPVTSDRGVIRGCVAKSL